MRVSNQVRVFGGACILVVLLVVAMGFATGVLAADRLVVKDGSGNTQFSVQDTGFTGIGVNPATFPLHVYFAGRDVGYFARSDSGSTRLGIEGDSNVGFGFFINDVKKWSGASYNKAGTGANFDFAIYNDQTATNSLFIDGDTNYVGIGRADTSWPLHMAGGAYCNGGAWIDGSSREYKKNIKELTGEEAMDTLVRLSPVRFNYKSDPNDEGHVGFIAEDVPDLVATKDRKGMSSMDVVAVLTKVVQEQQKTIAELSKRIGDLEGKGTKVAGVE